MNQLVGKEFRSLCRFFHFVLLSFGETILEEQIRLGDILLHSSASTEFTLQLTTEWHIRHRDRIVLASNDLYAPFSEESCGNDWDWSPTDRNDRESSVFDVVSRQVSDALQGHRVTRVECAPWGDIVILFSNGYVLETFVATSRKAEHWTLINNKTNDRTVFCSPDSR